ncbi:hypothetical protein ABGB14_10395 [Nonomuraea sp. B10E15]|uniref:hypothetical protein n=1 Tax=Nonomuraea sp. B10E15 TaxID=3153560 RepID=UPI00325DD5DC
MTQSLYYVDEPSHPRWTEHVGTLDVVRPGELTAEALAAWRAMQRGRPQQFSLLRRWKSGQYRTKAGLIQHVRMVEAAAAAGVRTIDLSVRAESEYKDALGNATGVIASGEARRPRLRGAA